MQLSTDGDIIDNSLSAENRGTGPDQYDMQRMGKTQETKVSLQTSSTMNQH